jgi:hypothetical protein
MPMRSLDSRELIPMMAILSIPNRLLLRSANCFVLLFLFFSLPRAIAENEFRAEPRLKWVSYVDFVKNHSDNGVIYHGSPYASRIVGSGYVAASYGEHQAVLGKGAYFDRTLSSPSSRGMVVPARVSSERRETVRILDVTEHLKALRTKNHLGSMDSDRAEVDKLVRKYQPDAVIISDMFTLVPNPESRVLEVIPKSSEELFNFQLQLMRDRKWPLWNRLGIASWMVFQYKDDAKLLEDSAKRMEIQHNIEGAAARRREAQEIQKKYEEGKKALYHPLIEEGYETLAHAKDIKSQSETLQILVGYESDERRLTQALDAFFDPATLRSTLFPPGAALVSKGDVNFMYDLWSGYIEIAQKMQNRGIRRENTTQAIQQINALLSESTGKFKDHYMLEPMRWRAAGFLEEAKPSKKLTKPMLWPSWLERVVGAYIPPRFDCLLFFSQLNR